MTEHKHPEVPDIDIDEPMTGQPDTKATDSLPSFINAEISLTERLKDGLGHIAVRAMRYGGYGARGATVLGGGLLGFMLGSQTMYEEGVADIKTELVPTLSTGGSTELSIGAIDCVKFPTHQGPIKNVVSVEGFNGPKLMDYLQDPAKSPDIKAEIESYQDATKDAPKKAVAGAAAGTLLAAMAGSLIEGKRNNNYKQGMKRWAPWTLAPTLYLGTAGYWAYNTLSADPTENLEYCGGLIETVPEVRDQFEIAVKDFDTYNEQLINAVYYLGKINQSLSNLKTVSSGEHHFIAAGDIHCMPGSYQAIEAASDNPSYNVKFVLLTGDFVDNGTALENACFDAISKIDLPIVAVKGNHDSPQTMEALRKKGVKVLDGETITIDGKVILGFGDPRTTIGENLSLKDRTIVADYEAGILAEHAKEVARLVEKYKPDIVLASHPGSLDEVIGKVPMTVSGDTHAYKIEVDNGTVFLNPGTLGGAGLRGYSTSLTQAVDRSQAIVGFDEAISSVTKINYTGVDEARAQVCSHRGCSEMQYCDVTKTALECRLSDNEEIAEVDKRILAAKVDD